MLCVLVGKKGRNADVGPADGDGRVVPHKAAFVFRMVKLGTLVSEDRRVGKDKKTMGESFRNVKLVLLFGRKNDTMPLAEGWGAGSDIHGNVEYFAFYAADQFALGHGFLVMEAPENAF